MYDILELSKKLLPELKDIAKQLNVKKAESFKKQDLIYKILDQQAIDATDINASSPPETEETLSSIEATDIKSSSPSETEESLSSIEATDIEASPPSETEETLSSQEADYQDSDSSLRRGKRPRTLKPIIKRSVQSVMSVSPDDLKRPDTRPADWKEPVKKIEKPEEKPDLFRKAQPVSEERKVPKWRTDQNHFNNVERKEQTNNAPAGRYERKKPEPVSDHFVENTQQSVSSDIPSEVPEVSEDVKPASDTYFGDIIVDAPVKEIIPEIIPVKEERKERSYDFEGIIYNTGVLEIMPDGYGFLRSPDYNYLRVLVYLVKTL